MAANLAPGFNLGAQFFTNQGVVLAGGLVYTYAAGSTTAQATYTDSTQATPNANPIVLDSAGRLPQSVWLSSGVQYKFILKTSTGVQVGQIMDYVTGINDGVSASQSQWISSGVSPTYISSTSFSVAGDQTGVLQVGRRLQMLNTVGTLYGTILTSVYSSLTTVTVSLDSGSLDSGLSTINMGIITLTNTSFPPGLIVGTGAVGANTDAIFVENDLLVTGNWTLGQQQLTTCTMTIASPCIITQSNSYIAGQPVRFSTTGALPTGLSTGNVYYVIATGLSTSSFQVSATLNGSAVGTSGTQSGTQKCGKVRSAETVGPLTIASGVSVTVPTGARLVIL